jgi:hypothetical protein
MRQEEEEEADEGGKRKLDRQVLRQLCQQEKEKKNTYRCIILGTRR